MKAKPPLAVDFALEDLQYLCKMAKYTFEHPPEIDLEYLDRVERDRQVPPCPKYQKDVNAAIRTVLAFLIWVIRNDALEGEAQS
jgi:hypothetical protein